MSGNVADHRVAQQQKLLTRRGFLIRSSLVAAGGLALYSGEFARHELSVVNRSLAVANLPGAFQNFRIAQISDIHFDEFTEPFFVRRVVERVNSLAPDLVLLTGDYVSNSPLPRRFAEQAMHRCADILRDLSCPQRFAVLGNHDDILGVPTIRPILASISIPLLVNQHIPIERGGQRLWLGGLADPVTGAPDLDLAIPRQPDGPVLLMFHAPDYADDVLAHPRGRLVDVMLTGHSHGGQVRLPFLGPIILPDGGRKYVMGLYRFNRLQLYVNRGIGSVGIPFRLNCPPEITLFTLANSAA
jgi:predicted MPP superfamily phosphohydrolase